MIIAVIKDIKANVYQKPFACDNLVTAERVMYSLVKDENSLLSQYPEDFQMMVIGKFDDVTGDLEVIKETMIIDGNQAASSMDAFRRQRNRDLEKRIPLKKDGFPPKNDELAVESMFAKEPGTLTEHEKEMLYRKEKNKNG